MCIRDRDTPAVGKPTEGALNHPTTCRVLGFTWDRALIRLRFTAPAAVFDVRDIVFQFKKVPNIGVIIATIKTEMLFRIRSVNHHRENQVLQRTFVVTIGGRDDDGQGCAAPVDQKVNFAARLATIGWIRPCFFTTQRCG